MPVTDEERNPRCGKLGEDILDSLSPRFCRDPGLGRSRSFIDIAFDESDDELAQELRKYEIADLSTGSVDRMLLDNEEL